MHGAGAVGNFAIYGETTGEEERGCNNYCEVCLLNLIRKQPIGYPSTVFKNSGAADCTPLLSAPVHGLVVK